MGVPRGPHRRQPPRPLLAALRSLGDAAAPLLPRFWLVYRAAHVPAVPASSRSWSCISLPRSSYGWSCAGSACGRGPRLRPRRSSCSSMAPTSSTSSRRSRSRSSDRLVFGLAQLLLVTHDDAIGGGDARPSRRGARPLAHVLRRRRRDGDRGPVRGPHVPGGWRPALLQNRSARRDVSRLVRRSDTSRPPGSVGYDNCSGTCCSSRSDSSVRTFGRDKHITGVGTSSSRIVLVVGLALPKGSRRCAARRSGLRGRDPDRALRGRDRVRGRHRGRSLRHR